MAKGVYSYSCAGHGGILVAIGLADIPERHLQAARELGKTEVVLEHKPGGHRSRAKRYTSAHYARSDLEATAAAHPQETKLREFWVGEEDCDWATVLHARPELAAKFGNQSITPDYIRSILQHNNEYFLAKVEDDYTPIPDGQIEKDQRHRDLLELGAFLRRSAVAVDGEDGEALSKVLVTFANKDEEMAYYLMDKAVYGTHPLATDVTPLDFLDAGEIKMISTEDAASMLAM